MRQTQQKSSTVKQKKRVREGSTFKIVGSLIDSTKNEPLMYCNVTLLGKEDSSFVKGAVTDANGYFEVKEVPAGDYLLRVSYIGYATRFIPVNVTNNTAMGTINMKAGASALKTVTIKASRPLYAMDGEKMVYNVAEDPTIQAGTTEDALQNAPGVEVDVEGNVTLRGVSSVEIWINDKPSKLTSENLKTYLQTLPANALDRIETITNPSAKYATEAEAVINIVTSAHIKSNQFVSFGVNGATQPFVSPWLSYMWAKEKLSVNFFVSGRYSYRSNTNESWSLSQRSHVPAGPTDTVQFDDVKDTAFQNSFDTSYSGNFFLGVNYEIDSMTEVSVDAGGFYNHSGSSSDSWRQQTVYLMPMDSITNDTTRSLNGNNSFMTHMGADYTKKFDLEGHNLRIGFNARVSHNASEQWYNRMYDTYTDFDEHRYLLNDNNSYGASLDARYNRPYSKDGEMSYGLRADFSGTNNDYRRFNDSLGTLIDTLRTYHFNGSDGSVDADVDWTHRWGGFTLSSGLGVGVNRTYYDYISDMPFADDSVYYTFDMHPSVHLSYRTEDMHNFKLNYTMRMSNPGEEQISSFRRYGNTNYSTGNAEGLMPSYTHSFEAGWQKFFERFGNIGVEVYGRHSTNEISSLTSRTYDDEYLPNRAIDFSIPYNMGQSWRYGASLNMTYRPTGFFNVRLYANVYDYGYHLDNYRGQPYGKDMWSWSVRLNAWAKLWNQYQVHVSANYNSRTLSLMSVRGERYSLNMGVRSDFFKRKLSVFVNVQDIFGWGAKLGSTNENTNPNYRSSSTNKMLNSTYISAGLTLRFGKMELERNAKEGEGETGDSL